jgi:hypothetical protein
MSMHAWSGYAAGMAAFCGWLLVQCQDLSQEPPHARSRSWRLRLLGGVLAGFATWQHPVFLAALLPGYVAAAVARRRELARWTLPTATGGVLGLAPYLAFNVTHSWAAFTEPPTPDWSYGFRLGRVLDTVLPRLLGVRHGDLSFQFAAGGWLGGDTVGPLLAISLGFAIVATFLIALRQPGPGPLLGITGLSSPLLLALFKNSIRNVDGRHAMFFLPLVILSLALIASSKKPNWLPSPTVIMVAPILWAMVFTLPGLRVEVSREWPIARLPEVIATLDRAGVQLVRANFWVAYPLTFATNDRIRAAEFGLVRFPDLEEAVVAAGDRIAYVVTPDHPVATDPRYARHQVGEWVICIPTDP